MDIIEYPTDAQLKAAYSAYRKALRDGTIVHGKACAWCGKGGRIHGHHPDYARPLMVVWICHTCHGAHHRKHSLDRWLFDDAMWRRRTHADRKPTGRKKAG